MTTVTDGLSREHQIVLRRLQEFEQAIERFDLEAIRDVVRFFDTRVALHRRKEEEVLFPALGRHIGTEIGPIACMLHEHRDEKEKLDVIRKAVETDSTLDTRRLVREAGRYVIELLRNHIRKEDEILFPMAETHLTEEEKSDVRKRMEEIGPCCPECGG